MEMDVGFWLFWILYFVVLLIISAIVGKEKRSYDFFSPLLGFGVFAAGSMLAVGFLIATIFF
jgi:hypothetical protein